MTKLPEITMVTFGDDGRTWESVCVRGQGWLVGKECAELQQAVHAAGGLEKVAPTTKLSITEAGFLQRLADGPVERNGR